MRSPNHFPCAPRASSHLAATLLAVILFSLTFATQTRAQSASNFRWLSPAADAYGVFALAERGELLLEPGDEGTAGKGGHADNLIKSDAYFFRY